MTKVLSLDGGGIRGLYSLKLLKKFEDKVGNLDEYFDIITGTSTGAIIATFIRLGYSIDEITEKYHNFFPIIFNHQRGDGFLKTQYDTKRLRDVIYNYMGDNRIKKTLIINSYNISSKKPAIFKFEYHDDNNDEMIKEAIISSCSAPHLFKPNFINNEAYSDGGIVLNDPSLIGYAEAIKREYGITENVKILSIGTINSLFETKEIYNNELIDELVAKFMKNDKEEEPKNNLLSEIFSKRTLEKLIVTKIKENVKTEQGAFASYIQKYVSGVIDANAEVVNIILKDIYEANNCSTNYLRINHKINEKLSLIKFDEKYYNLIENDNTIDTKMDEFINNIPKNILYDKIQKMNSKLMLYRILTPLIFLTTIALLYIYIQN